MRIKKRKISDPPIQEIHSSSLEWTLEPYQEKLDTAVVHIWETKDGQYRVLRLESIGLDRPAFGAERASGLGGKFWDTFEYSHSQGPGYPRYYKSLEEALRSVELFHMRRAGLESIRTNIEEVVIQARKQVLDGINRRKIEKEQTDSIRKPSRKNEGKMGCLEAAVLVLQEENRPLRADEMIPLMSERGYWTSPGGKTPGATLSAAIGVEIRVKGKEARFVKVGRGLFSLVQ